SMGGSIAIEAAGLLGERVTTLLVSEPNLFAGGGEYSRRIAAQSESAFVADGYARLQAARQTAQGALFCKQPAHGERSSASSLA
ncbi:alpha/beta fold hydrolase, partial [Klebsiella pneumoniae]